jgi:hypothetical protein
MAIVDCSRLGTNPKTGADYIPSGLIAAAAGRYRIDDVLIDAELFRRLRVRGLARGADGIGDLCVALDLVAGRPFDLSTPRQGTAGGYGWLIDEDARLDLEYAAMIVDVAHSVATHYLGAGQPEFAEAAAQVALKAGTTRTFECSTSSRPATPRTSGQRPTPTSPASWPTTTPR